MKEASQPNPTNTIVLVPAFNEERNIPSLMAEFAQALPGYPIAVISDGSMDRTAALARSLGAQVIDLPCNLGVGGAIQAGFQYAVAKGYTYALRCDGDGQHPPAEAPKLIAAMAGGTADMVIGSRFLADGSYTSTWVRTCGIRLLAATISLICRKPVTDPTSGFQMISMPLLSFFADAYPTDYPEPEALALLRREGYDFMEVPTLFRKRRAGVSTIRGWGTIYYVVKVFLALIIDRARPVSPRYARYNMTRISQP